MDNVGTHSSGHLAVKSANIQNERHEEVIPDGNELNQRRIEH